MFHVNEFSLDYLMWNKVPVIGMCLYDAQFQLSTRKMQNQRQGNLNGLSKLSDPVELPVSDSLLKSLINEPVN